MHQLIKVLDSVFAVILAIWIILAIDQVYQFLRLYKYAYGTMAITGWWLGLSICLLISQGILLLTKSVKVKPKDVFMKKASVTWLATILAL